MSRPKTFEPARLDLRALAESGAPLAGELSASALSRLAASTLATDTAPPAVPWNVAAELRPVTGGPPELWLRLKARAHVTLQCQRCLQPLPQALDIDRWFRFAASEEEAARLDEDSEDDVLVESRRFDLPELIEDELILALPLVPRHDECPAPLVASAGEDVPEATRPNPFAALAALRRTREEG